MEKFSYIISEGPEKGVARIILNRPEVHNAFHIEMIREIRHAINAFNSDNKNL